MVSTRFPWQNPWGAQGRPPNPEAHALASRVLAAELRQDLIRRHRLEDWQARARWHDIMGEYQDPQRED